MMRRGQCRCGTILHFQKTSQGYKKRCPECGAIVRLRSERKRSSAALAAFAAPPVPPVPGAMETEVLADVLPPHPALPHLTPDEVPNAPALSEENLPAPQAFAELAVFPEPAAKSGGSLWPWILIGLLAVVVIALIATATLLWT